MKLNTAQQKELEKIVRNIGAELRELGLLALSMDESFNNNADRMQKAFDQIFDSWETINDVCLDEKYKYC